VSHLIQQGKVLFPRHGTEPLITQMTGFGKERHDDLLDALVTMLLYVMGDDTSGITIPDGPWNNIGDKKPKTREELDHEADMDLIRESNYKRSDYDPSLRNRSGDSGNFIW